MKRIISKIFHCKRYGFTLIEILVGIAILGVIAAAAAGGVFQVVKGSPDSNNRMQAINNVQNASDWISQDARNAESYIAYTGNEVDGWVEVDTDTIVVDTAITKLEFFWTEQDSEGNPEYSVMVTYLYNDDNTVERKFVKQSVE